MAVIIDMDMPINCVDCDRRYIRGLLDCKLIFSGCANCGRHPNCPLKSTDDVVPMENIDNMIAEINSRLDGVNYTLEILVKNDNMIPVMKGAKDAIEECLDIINKYCKENT